MNSDNLCVVLVEPQGPLNIGSVCRAMMNFGFSDLRLVNPVADHLSEDARRMAVKAFSLLENARMIPRFAVSFGRLQSGLWYNPPIRKIP